MNRSKLVSYLDTVLDISAVDDYSYNGLQFEGSQEIRCVGVAVDSGIGTFQMAATEDVDFLIVHHGLYWKRQNPVVTGVHKKRLAPLWENEISLYAAHLPLDIHLELGNNAGLLNMIGGNRVDGLSLYQGAYIGTVGELSTGQSIESISDLFADKLQCSPSMIKVSDNPITKVAILSGAGSRNDLAEAAEKGADLFITGEASEFYHDAHDFGISVLFLGHHASETVGVRLLMERISTDFPELDTTFISFPTGC